ncbi:hypothetical protein LCGC14_1524840 [marine sediment metagenome]|uniref:Uncharacterized protein n=1 Tax=marine sediment metagenome TaxID=412755 RepID=A0A0F9IXG7_9ZZZZ
MSNHKTILIADDDENLRRIIEYNLSNKGYRVLLASNGEEALDIFKNDDVDIAVTDIKMEKIDGIELLEEIKKLKSNALVIMITAHGSIETAVKAMKLGAHDYITKPFDRDELQIVIEKALNLQSLMVENIRLRQELTDRFSLNNVIGVSSKMKKIYDLVARVAKSDSTVLLQGESGTGKELIARAIHFNSSRAEKPFVTVNCSAIPENLLESELFGYVKGAFTGAIKDKPGKFEAANSGTIFLDEIGDIRKDLQAKLLRVLQEKSIDKVGATQNIYVDVRVIAATNILLEIAVKEGKFREDLYYRISVIPILLPPLRERKDDIIPLAKHYIHKFNKEFNKEVKGLTPEIEAVLKNYTWPGNIRELKNVIERAVLICDNTLIGPEHLSGSIRSAESFVDEAVGEGLSIDDYTRAFVSGYQDSMGEQELADRLGITRKTLWEKRKKWGLKRSS